MSGRYYIAQRPWQKQSQMQPEPSVSGLTVEMVLKCECQGVPLELFGQVVSPLVAGHGLLTGWVPHAVAKRVSLCRVAAEWPEEGGIEVPPDHPVVIYRYE